ncbi:hypothetical protein BDV96DRAFT_579370 [Lophiotrema nucula]|uniref:Uncharacterized protein n=1 Tax=Lophiotrema nucula TaxID=690887 RepID=A0A6A5Z3C7_9PLEO|nr:hypothetical protein BDV96DRAFT_579370 [Lophiotrema nucula]
MRNLLISIAQSNIVPVLNRFPIAPGNPLHSGAPGAVPRVGFLSVSPPAPAGATSVPGVP